MLRLEKIVGAAKEPTYIFDECDLNGVTIGIADYRASEKGTEATITIDSLRSDTKVVHPCHVSYNILTEKVHEYVAGLCVNEGSDLDIEKVDKDSVDESLLEDAQPAEFLDPVEIATKRGWTKGAIIVVGKGYDTFGEVSYGILESVYQGNDNLKLKLTDGREVDWIDCQIANDVNKQIFRMVEAEKGRIMENAIKFGESIEQNLEKIIFG